MWVHVWGFTHSYQKSGRDQIKNIYQLRLLNWPFWWTNGMSVPQSTRRRFLKGTAAGAGAFAFGGLVTGTAGAQDLESTVIIGEANAEIADANGPNDWNRVEFNNLFVDSLADLGVDPVVTMKPPSYRGTQPVHIRLRNVGQDGFEYKLEEWDYQDQPHARETMFWVAVAPVVAEIPTVSGAAFSIRAGKTHANTEATSVDFSAGTFDNPPAVIPQSQTFNGKADSIVTRLAGPPTSEGFSVFVQEQESLNNYHQSEEVGYIAAEVPRGGDLLSILEGPILTEFEARRPTRGILDSANQARRIPFTLVNNGNGFSNNPRVVTAMQTRRGPQPANLRYTDLARDHMDLFVQEEQSADAETTHATEDVGFLAFGGNGLINAIVVQVTI